MTISAVVNGTIRFLDREDHEGAWGLVGGEDVQAVRSTFRSVGEAMTWARRVLDGKIRPRWAAVGPIVGAHTPPRWNDARVRWTDGRDEQEWTSEGGPREWRELRSNDRIGEVARIDPEDI